MASQIASTASDTKPRIKQQPAVDFRQDVTEEEATPGTIPVSLKSSPASCHDHNIQGAVSDIAWAVTCVTLPMLVLTAIFIGLVFGYEVRNHEDLLTVANSSDVRSATDSSAYYVNYSATRLITVSTWTSTATSLTLTFVMVLVSYPIAKLYLRLSASGRTESLPTAYQLRLIVGMLGGGLGTLWAWLKYCCWRTRSKQTRLLWLSVTSLMGAAALSVAILAVDTWLHVTTSTVNYDTLSPPATTPASSYGRTPLPVCHNGTDGTGSLCINTYPKSTSGYLFPSQSEVVRTLLNLSTVNVVLPSTLRNKKFAYLTAAGRDPDLDYQASTLSVQTECTPASSLCNLQSTQWCVLGNATECNEQPWYWNAAVEYRCAPTLYGNMDNSTSTAYSTITNGTITGDSLPMDSFTGFFIQFFRKNHFVGPISWADTPPNPFYFTLGAQVAISDAMATDPEAMLSTKSGDSGFIFTCKSTYLTMEYTVVNKTLADASEPVVMNNALAMNAFSVFTSSVMGESQNAIEAAFMGGAQQANNSQQLADIIAQRFSETMLSMVSGITVESQNIAEQRREHLLVTKLPKAPFFTLIVLNLLYALLGIVLAIVALASQPDRTRNLQSRLSIGGLVAALLETKIIENASGSDRSKSGIEAAFSEYYNEEKHADNGRILVGHRCGNHVFEKISLETVMENGITNDTTKTGDRFSKDSNDQPSIDANPTSEWETSVPPASEESNADSPTTPSPAMITPSNERRPAGCV